MTVLRSPLFIPGNRPEMLEKALSLRPDAYVPDLEDAVAADQKERAREVTSSFLPRLAQIGLPVVPRVNSLDSGLLEEDLKAVVGPHIFGVSVGKIRSAAEVRRISGIMEGLEEQAGVKAGETKLVLWLETAMAIVRAYEICAASPQDRGRGLRGRGFHQRHGHRAHRGRFGDRLSHERGGGGGQGRRGVGHRHAVPLLPRRRRPEA